MHQLLWRIGLIALCIQFSPSSVHAMDTWEELNHLPAADQTSVDHSHADFVDDNNPSAVFDLSALEQALKTSALAQAFAAEEEYTQNESGLPHE